MAFMINSWHFLPQEEIKDDLKTSRRSQGVEKITVTRRTQRQGYGETKYTTNQIHPETEKEIYHYIK